jgi:tetratricopeptide (TPR) repeat protein
MDQPSPRARAWLIAALLVLCTLAAFWPIFRNGFIRYDDATYVTSNPRVLGGLSWENLGWALRTGHAANWHPVTWLSHQLDVQLFGLKAGWHHAMSLVLHLANTLLLFIFLHRTTRALWPSACVAGLFALHPLHVESVAWVAERKDVLSGFFFFLTLLAYSRYIELAEVVRQGLPGSSLPENPNRKAARYYSLAILFCALGLMSKPMLVTVPFVLILLDVWPLQRVSPEVWLSNKVARASSLRRVLPDKIPFFALALLSSGITFMVQERQHAVTIALPLGSRVANAVASYLKYIGKTFWPTDLAIFYPHPDTRFPVSEQWPLWALLLALLLLILVSLLALKYLGRSPWLAAGWFFYLGMLVPVIGLIQVGGQALADRYTYLPLIGLFICLVWGIRSLCHQLRSSVVAMCIPTVATFAVCAILSFQQAGRWENNLTVFEHALAVTRNNAVAHSMVGVEYGERGEYALAIRHFQAAIQAAPANADGYFGLGYTYDLLGKADQAREQYLIALRLRPWDEAIHRRLGGLAWAAGDSETAMRHFREAVRLNPDYFGGQLALGSAMAETQNFAEALPHLQAAVRLRPDSKEAVFRCAVALSNLGQPQAATTLFQRLIQLDPTNAEHYINLGGTLWAMGKTAQALAAYSEAVKVRPSHPVAHFNLATALLAQNRVREASAEFAEAVRLKPDYPQALTGWGRAQTQAGDFEAAMAHFEKALQLRPDAFTCYHAGRAQLLNHRPQDAITSFRRALELRPNWPMAMNELAWTLATNPDPTVRNGEEAVRLAERACQLTDGKDLKSLAVLDAAYAEANRFEEAIATATKVRDLAVSLDEPKVVTAAETRLQEYRNRHPYRQQPAL